MPRGQTLVLDPNRDCSKRFWSYVDRRGPDECWPWKGGYFRLEYGCFNVPVAGGGFFATRAHRVAWTLENGPIPPGLDILHSCDNPPCCNPAHLRPGTPAENVADMVRRGRHARGRRLSDTLRGERNGMSRLTARQVAKIKRMYKRRSFAYGSGGLARIFGVSKGHINNILRGQRWTHVKAEGSKCA